MASLALLRERRFSAIFITQFFGAFNDTAFKTALLIQITFYLAVGSTYDSALLTTLAAGAFIFPFFIFSATAGQLADKYEKSRLMRILKTVELLLMVATAMAFYYCSIEWLLTLLFLIGTQATFFGPLKYGILPEQLRAHELVAGNALIEAATFLAILLGTLFGNLCIALPHGHVWIGFSLILFSIIGQWSSQYIPSTGVSDPSISVGWNIARETYHIMRESTENTIVFRAIIAISWFWLVGATFLAQFPTYARDIIHGDESVVTLFLIIFSVGIAIGAMGYQALQGIQRQSYLISGAALGMSCFISDLFFAAPVSTYYTYTWWSFLIQPIHWRVLIDLLLIAICSGIYIVPLYVIAQTFAAPGHRSRVIACNNVLNALFMCLSAAGVALFYLQGLNMQHVFLVLGILNLGIIPFCIKLPYPSTPATLPSTS